LLEERDQTIKKEIQLWLWAYMATIYRNHDITVKAVGGLDDSCPSSFSITCTSGALQIRLSGKDFPPLTGFERLN